MGSPRYFLNLRDQKMKNIVKIEQKGLFLFAFLVLVFMAFLAQELICTKNIWFKFLFG